MNDAISLTEPPSRPLRLGVVGAGWVARACHLPAIAALRQHGWSVSVAAIADSSEEAVAAAVAAAPELLHDARGFADGEALLQAAATLRLDAVLLLTPPEVTTRLLRSTLALGLTTFAEKPVSQDAATLAALTETATHPNAPPVQVGYNRRWQPLAPDFRRQVARLRAAESSTLHLEANLWRGARSEAIFYRDTMIHAVDFLLWCVGPLEVSRVALWPPAVPGGIPSGLRAELKTTGSESPVTVHLDVRPAVGRSRESYLALGAKTSIELTYPPAGNDIEPGRLTVWDGVDPAGSGIREAPPCPAGDNAALWGRGFLGQMAGFLSLVGSGAAGADPCNLADALAARRLTDAILVHEATAV